MAEYCPPLENVPIFNDAYFQCDNVSSGSGIGYLQYPTAQGDETLQGITVNGLSNFLSKATFQDIETNSTTDIKGVSNFTNIMNITNTASYPMNILNFPYIGNYMATPSSNQLISKYYADITYNGSALLNSNNYWYGANFYNTILPRSTLTPSNQFDFTNKYYVDASIGYLLTSANVWSGSNSYTSIPSCNVNPANPYDLTNKQYVDSFVSNAFITNNWVSQNTFNSVLPTSTLTPTTGIQLAPKSYVDSVVVSPTTLLSSNNSWSGTNTFSNDFSITNNTTTINPSYLYFNTAPTAKYDGGVIGYSEPTIKISDSIYGNTSATTGSGNVLIGKNIMNTSNSSAYYNTIIGLNNLTNLVSGGENVAIGYGNNPNPSSTNTCVSIGSYNLYNNISGFSNIAIGNANIASITSGIYNVGIGRSSCSSNGQSNSNRCVGIGIFATANLGSVSGANVENNTGVGYCALNGSGDNASGYDNVHFLDGSNNTGIGYCAGLKLNGASNNNTFLGANADVSSLSSTYQQSTAIGYGATITGSNQIVLGTSTESTEVMGRLDINNGFTQSKIQLITTTPLSPASTDSGTYYNLNLATTGTLNLPNANALNGMDFTFCNVGSGRWNMSPAGGVFNQFNSSNTLIWIWSGDIIRIRSNGTNWYVVGNNWDCIKSSRASSINANTNLTLGVQSSPSWYPFAGSTTAITANITLTLPLFNTYIITATATTTITLPSAAAVLVGCKITFRKVGGTIGLAHNIVPAATQNIIPFGSVTTQTTSTPLLSATATAINYISATVICYNATSWMIVN